MMIPRAFLKDERYRGITPHAMVLYGMMRDRSLMSRTRKDFIDASGAYVIFRRDEICDTFRCGHNKAATVLKELEKFGLITAKNQGNQKAVRYYVENLLDDHPISDVRASENEAGDVRKKDGSGVRKRDCSYKYDSNYKDLSHTESNQSANGTDPIWAERLIKENVEYDVLLEKDIQNESTLREIIGIMVDTVCGDSKTVTIGKADLPRDRVRERFLNYDAGTLEYVLYCLKKNKTRIINIRSYLLTTLFYAPVTMNNFYDAAVRHDLGV